MRAGKRFTLFISSEDMNDIIKIIKPLEYLSVLINEGTETVKSEIKKQQEGKFLGAFLVFSVVSLGEPVISSLVKVISGRELRRARRGYMHENFYFCSIL